MAGSALPDYEPLLESYHTAFAPELKAGLLLPRSGTSRLPKGPSTRSGAPSACSGSPSRSRDWPGWRGRAASSPSWKTTRSTRSCSPGRSRSSWRSDGLSGRLCGMIRITLANTTSAEGSLGSSARRGWSTFASTPSPAQGSPRSTNMPGVLPRNPSASFASGSRPGSSRESARPWISWPIPARRIFWRTNLISA